jgi:hypothetical protein
MDNNAHDETQLISMAIDINNLTNTFSRMIRVAMKSDDNLFEDFFTVNDTPFHLELRCSQILSDNCMTVDVTKITSLETDDELELTTKRVGTPIWTALEKAAHRHNRILRLERLQSRELIDYFLYTRLYTLQSSTIDCLLHLPTGVI